MRGGGKVNYTSGSLARAKARSKASQSPNRPVRRTSSALFPQKIHIPSPLRKRTANVRPEMDLEEPTQTSGSPSKTQREVIRTKEEWMRDSDLAMARRAGGDVSSQTQCADSNSKADPGRGWWVGYGRGSGAGKQYQIELSKILAIKKSDEKGKKVKDEERAATATGVRDALFDRSDCLDTPHWIRHLPRQEEVPMNQDD